MEPGVWTERAREAWPWLRAVGYVAVFLWWTGRDAEDPWYALLLGVFVADMATWVIFEAMQAPFRGARFALELAVCAVLMWLVWRASPYRMGEVSREVMPFAAFGFLGMFVGKCLKWLLRWFMSE